MILTEKSAEIDAPPPAYDTLSIHRGAPSIPVVTIAVAHEDEAGPSTSNITDMREVERPRSRIWARTLSRSKSNIDFATERYNDAVAFSIPPGDVAKLLPERPPLGYRQTIPASASSLTQKRKQAKTRKAKSGSSSWLSLLPFSSSRATKQVRQSILTLVHDLVVLPPASSISPSSTSPQSVPADPHEVLGSCARSCSAKNLSLSTLLQEPVVAGHTPIYWAIVNYRPALLDALLRHASPLTPVTLSEMRKACLVASNQALFQNLRLSVGLCASGLRSAADGLLLGQRPPDDVRIEEGLDGAFAATLDIAMWQKRIRAVGSVSVEFMASGRIFVLTFFTTDRPQPTSNCIKSKRAVGPWHVSLSLLEHSMPTYVDAVVVIDRPPPLPSPGSSLRARSSGKKGLAPPKGYMDSTSFSGEEKSYGFENGAGCTGDKTGIWDFNYDNQAHTRSPSSPSSPKSPSPATSPGVHMQTHAQTLPPPPVHPHRALVQSCSSPSLKLLSSSSSNMLTHTLDKATAHAPKKQFVKLKNASLGTGGRAPVVLRFCAGEAMVACRNNGYGGEIFSQPIDLFPFNGM
ncbi:uncharacterized protein EDB91DRAFT_709473 [Suillus paluster]|uniref:uncharacterized protein n=1 Tax=Suillus paluster TaxID=48578 RepID=UPI001B878FB8|nr:uncharacterized protein EDB91DRAFT_709473 [Suillus paluster]KAG1731847.1 hypothetical protein EDB91DRAFT_709473 [Suillus paluster]